MKIISLFSCILCLFFFSCKSTEVCHINTGKFLYVNKKHPSYKTELTLNPDSTFTLSFYGSFSPKCSGRWSYAKSNMIQLDCENEPIENAIARGYLNQRKWSVKILNNDKLKLRVEYNVDKIRNEILKRTE